MKKLILLFCLMASGLVWSQPLLISQGTALGNPNNPIGGWANTAVDIWVDNSFYTLTSNANGFYSDSLPAGRLRGTIQASVIDCNGHLVFGNVDSFDLTLGINTANDTLVICGPSMGTTCQAEFIVDTTISSGGNVYLWNTSTPANPFAQAQFIWDFGDGSMSTNPYPSHQYAQAGMYQVCLTMITPPSPSQAACTSVFCDSLGFDANGNLIYKELGAGFNLIVIDSMSIGQDESELNEFRAYPNPAISEIRLSGFDGSAEYQLMDLGGRRLKMGEAEADTPIDLTYIGQGIYLMDVLAEGKRQQLRILIRQ